MSVVRKTKSVKRILEVFEQSSQALSGVELIKQFQDDMNKTTVYRILERLEKDGMLHSFTGKDGLKWYAKYEGLKESSHLDSHPHFQCRACGKSECLSLEIDIPTIPNHKIEAANFILIGQCEDCLS